VPEPAPEPVPLPVPLPLLTADLGNRRLKLRAWAATSNSAPLAAVEIAGAPLDLVAAAAPWLRDHPAERGALCSVAAPEVEARVVEALAGACGSLLRSPEAGLEMRVREPQGVGRDRVLAARGALARLGTSCLVVDVGTALTVDAVLAGEPGKPGAPGVFLGGAIAPGPELLAEALHRGTARLPRVDPRPAPPPLGRDTEEAIASGVALGLFGAARELVRRIGAETGLAGAPVALTGGARAFLLEPEPFDPRVVVFADLVHHGLLEVLADPPREAGGAAP